MKTTLQTVYGTEDVRRLLREDFALPWGEYGVTCERWGRLRWFRVRLAPCHARHAPAIKQRVLAELLAHHLVGHCDLLGFSTTDYHLA